MAEIREIKPADDVPSQAQRILGRTLRDIMERHGDGLVGFAIVSWDQTGAMHSVYLAESGPVTANLVPTLVHDALNRHVAVDMMREARNHHIDGGI